MSSSSLTSLKLDGGLPYSVLPLGNLPQSVISSSLRPQSSVPPGPRLSNRQHVIICSGPKAHDRKAPLQGHEETHPFEAVRVLSNPKRRIYSARMIDDWTRTVTSTSPA